MVIPSMPGTALLWRTRFHALTILSIARLLHQLFRRSRAFGCWLRHEGFGPLVTADRGFTLVAGFQGREYWIVCRVSVMSCQSYLQLPLVGPSANVSGSAYLLLRLSALECLAGLCRRLGLLPPSADFSPRSGGLSAFSVAIATRSRIFRVSSIAFGPRRRIYASRR